MYVVLVKSQSGSSILLPRVATFIKVIYNFGDEGFAQAKTLITKIVILRGSIHYSLELVSLTGMSNLLNSTYTFLFTDIESSTYLAQQFPDALPALLTRHHQILKEAIYTSHGQIFQIVGDAFCVAFQTAREAVDAALGAQRSLQQEVNEFSSLRVRMGIHTGVASPADMNAPASSYAGYLTLARTQRIMSIAHGGQILLSNATAELLRGQLPEGVSLRDMDEHHLKGLALPEHLWQIVVPGLPSEFPPLLLDIKTSNNLPVQLTSFIGREQEIREIKILVDRTHMITLTGPGGTGKTRLSLQIAGEMLDRFVDGVWFVDLAPLTDATLVPQAVAAALRILEQPGRPMSVQLTEYLRPKKLLIVLDNCEHLVSACAHLASTLLQNCPELRMIASSREPLNIIGEVSYPVTPLPIPDLKEQVMLSRLVQYESVRLFVERAQTLQPRFTLTDANADAVAQICNRLDGIPLAIELAAARVKLFTPEQIAARLDDRFRLLVGGSRTVLPRQQTLHALIEWSYDLLSPAECALMRRLSVFAGGWTFDAAEFVCTQIDNPELVEPSDGISAPIDLLDALAQLVNKSLVVTDEGDRETRYHFLETIRQFAQDKLLESGEVVRVRNNHLNYFLAHANQAEPQLHGPEQVKWFDRLDIEEDNLRAAQAWALESNQVEKALELAAALWWYWYIRDHFGEAQERMSTTLARSAGEEPSEARLKVMIGLGFMQYAVGDLRAAKALLEESVQLSNKLGSRYQQAEALQFLGATEIEIAKSTTGRFDKVRDLMEQALTQWQELQDKTGISWEKNLLANLARAEGDLPQARAQLEESVALRKEVGDRFLLAYSLRRLAEIALLQGDYSAAESYYREAHSDVAETGGKAGVATSLAGFASLALAQGQVIRAVRLFGAAQSILQALNWRLPPADEQEYERALAKVHQQLDESTFNAAWEEGRMLSMDQAIAYALSHVAT